MLVWASCRLLKQAMDFSVDEELYLYESSFKNLGLDVYTEEGIQYTQSMESDMK